MIKTIEQVDDVSLKFILMHLRDDDKAECYAACMLTPDKALAHLISMSDYAYVGALEGQPICIYGVYPSDAINHTGVPWLLGTKFLDKYASIFLKNCRAQVDEMMANYDRLENYVDERNTAAKKWLKWLGFEFDEPVPYGPFNLPFRRFWKEKQCVS